MLARTQQYFFTNYVSFWPIPEEGVCKAPYGLEITSGKLGAPQSMHHLIAPIIEAVQLVIDYLKFWLTFSLNDRFVH